MILVDLDGTRIDSKETLHEIFREALNLEDYYGCNLDALYDVLSTYSEPVEINIREYEAMCDNLSDYANRLINVLQVAMEENPNYITLNLQDEDANEALEDDWEDWMEE